MKSRSTSTVYYNTWCTFGNGKFKKKWKLWSSLLLLCCIYNQNIFICSSKLPKKMRKKNENTITLKVYKHTENKNDDDVYVDKCDVTEYFYLYFISLFLYIYHY